MSAHVCSGPIGGSGVPFTTRIVRANVPAIKIVVLISTYMDSLAQGAVRSAFEAEPDAVMVAEGRAGPPIEDPDVPPTTLGAWEDAVHFCEGTWHTDGQKRTWMARHAVETWGAPLWGVWLDGDEVLVNGRWLRDRLQLLTWQDDERIAAQPDEPPTCGHPLRVIELDGSVAVAAAKCIRLDLVKAFLVSSSAIKFKTGVMAGYGNQPDSVRAWWGPRMQAVREDKRYLEPPLPLEPYVVHRSGLRHPKRAELRMHQQEEAELIRLGMKGS